MALSSSFCARDKRDMDNLYYMSSRQGVMDWYQRMKDSDDKLQATLSAYHERNPDTLSAGGPKRKKTSTGATLQTLEHIISASKVIHSCEGEMMWEKEYIQFAQTLKGGRLTDDAARAQWLAWMQAFAAGDQNIITDSRGPAGFPTRIWIKTADKVLFQNSFEKSKGLSITNKPEKIKDDSQVDKAYRALQVDHDKIGGASATASNPTMLDIARRLAETLKKPGVRLLLFHHKKGLAITSYDIDVADSALQNLLTQPDEMRMSVF